MHDTAAQFATSQDGTRLALWTTGSGPVIILVVGAFNDHNTGAELAAALADGFTVVTYDRRGRGQSGDAAAYAVAREIEDLSAILAAVGGQAAALGFSSGAALALLAAGQGVPFSKLILMDAPWMLSSPGPRPGLDLASRLHALAAAGKRGEAVELFQRDYIGMPEPVIAQLRTAPFRPYLEALAPTLSYDATIMGDLTFPDGLADTVQQPVLLLHGQHSPAWMGQTAATIAQALAHAQHAQVAGIGHDLSVALVPHIERFMAGA